MSQSIFSRDRLATGWFFFALTAVAGIRMTLAGMGGDLELEETRSCAP